MKIHFVANEMLPIPPLPNASLTFALPAIGTPLVMWQTTRENCFDQSPAQCERSARFTVKNSWLQGCRYDDSWSFVHDKDGYRCAQPILQVSSCSMLRTGTGIAVLNASPTSSHILPGSAARKGLRES